MGVVFDKRRNKYIVRETIDGKRTYIGQYDTEKLANLIDLQNKPSVLSEQKLEYVEDNVSFNWLAAYREWSAQRTRAKESKRILNGSNQQDL